MNKPILALLFLTGALVLMIPPTTGAVGQEEREQQVRNPDQNTHQQRNIYGGQQQFSNADYTYEETADRNWLEEQLQKHNNQRTAYDRYWGADYAYEETVDRDWLTEHNRD